MIILVLACPVVGSTASAVRPADDLAALKGTWKVADSVMGGTGAFLAPFRKSGKPPDTVRIDGDKLTFLRGTDTVSEGTLTVDASKTPAAIDFVSDKTTYLGIYELKGDTLRICFVEGKERPKDVKGTKEGTKSVVALTLQRAK
jgi:uncharacterized protein (TIGR03067 family)